jgi:hypothetical protein
VQPAPEDASPGVPEGSGVQSVIENVRVLHAISFIMHKFGDLA